MTVTLDDMYDKLLTVGEVRETLAASEPLHSFPVEAGTKFNLRDWNYDPDVIKKMSDVDLVDASVSVGSQEFRLTKEALLDATSKIGLPKAYVLKTPASLVQSHLNYWADRGLDSQQFLVSHDHVVALTKSTLVPFSNLALIDNICRKIGPEDIRIDYKFNHSLSSTNIRFVLPERSRVLHTGTDDDEWSVGLQLTNSLTGDKQTSIEGYLFRWWCTNGAISKHASSGTWSRKRSGQGEEVYDWARSAVDDVLGGLDGALTEVERLVNIPIEGMAADVLNDVFSEYRIPKAQHESIVSRMLESDLNMYEVLNAITSVANDRDLNPDQVERLLSAGGDLAHTTSHRCEACHRRISR